MNENLKKVAEMVKNDENLKEKISAEAKRLAETMTGKDANEILAKAATNVLGIDISTEDSEIGNAGVEELAAEAMAEVVGGTGNGFWDDVECFFGGHKTRKQPIYEKRVPGRDYYVRILECERCFKKIYQKVHKDGVVEHCDEYDVSIY